MAKRSRAGSNPRPTRSTPPAVVAPPPGRAATAVVLVAFAILFVAITVGSYTQKSATWDEPIHMADGYASLAQHDYRIDPEHPPFLRIWAALPLLVMHVTPFDASVIDQTASGAWAWALYSYCEKFLYFSNDADHLLYASRFMTVLLGIALGTLLFAWAKEWLGFWPAVVALALYTVEPNIVAHASLVTTDFGLACFMFATLYFLWRTCRQPTALNVTALTIAFSLAIVSKFSALILGPIVAVLLAGAAARRSTMTPLRALGLVALLAVASWVAIWAVYGFRYAPSATGAWLYTFQTDKFAQTRVPTLARVVGWIDSHHLVPNVFSEGFLLGQAKAQVRQAFLLGSYSDHGWWYYFPVAFLVKTPVATLLFIAAGVAVAVRHWRRLGVDTLAFIVVPIVLYLGVAMAARINIGLRHILPLYPLALLLAAAAAKQLMVTWSRRGVIVIGALCGLSALEFASVYPDNLAFFNILVGGPSHGSEYLVDSNLDWGQDLKPLKLWMDANGVSHINLVYFGTAYPPYYGIDATHLPGSSYYAPGAGVDLPGYVAISATALNGVYLPEAQRALYRPFHTMAPVATIGHSIFVYRVEQPWW